ncbi:MAG: 50S ribosomal protein L17, partial [Candidatus Eisenbacteria bacterium]|nr:50S ribosomal protein L17 [Candidatus Eisenbacteria bacterium]
MRHRKKGRKLNRTWSHRKALMRNMVTTFIEQEQIETTDAKAKELRPLAEKLVTLAKRGGDDLSARRRALRIVRSRKMVAKLFDELGPRYADRPGGYTRIVKVENRRGDAAPLSVLKFVTEPVSFKETRHRPEEEMDSVGPGAAKPEKEAEPEKAAEEAPEAEGGTEESAAGDSGEGAEPEEGKAAKEAGEKPAPDDEAAAGEPAPEVGNEAEKKAAETEDEQAAGDAEAEEEPEKAGEE